MKRLVAWVSGFAHRFMRPGFARSVGILTSGTILAQGLGVLTVPMVSRLYDPKDFGEFALISSVSALLSGLISLGLQSAVVKASSEEESQRILTVAVGVAAALATIAVGAVLLMTPLARLLDTSLPLAVACLVVGFSGFLASANGSLRSYANRHGRNRVLFTNSLVGAASTLVITVPLGLLGTGVVGLLCGSLGGLLASHIQMILRLNPFRCGLTVADVKEVFRSNWSFVAFQYPANLVETVSAQAPRQALSLLFGNVAVGLYAMTDKMLGIPLRLVGAPIGTVYFREASQRVAAGKNLASFTLKLVFTIMAVGYLPIIVLVVWGEPLFSWLLGAEWAGAGAVASILAVQYLFALTRTCVGTARVALGRQGVNFAMSTLRLLLEVGALVVGSLVTQDVVMTLICFSVASTAFYLVDMTATFSVMGRSRWRYLVGASAYYASIACVWLFSHSLGT